MKHLKLFKNFDEMPDLTGSVPNIIDSINIIDTIKRTDIEGAVSPYSKYAMLNPSGKFIQKFYRIVNVKFNDGTEKDILEHESERGIWMPSSYNTKDINKLKDIKFLEIID